MNKINVCLRCGWQWRPFVKVSKQCPHCKTPYWNKPRVRPRRSRMPQIISPEEIKVLATIKTTNPKVWKDILGKEDGGQT